MEFKILLICLMLAHSISTQTDDYSGDYYDYDIEPQDCSVYKKYNYRCVRKDHCQNNTLTVKLDLALIEAQAELGLCPPQTENDPRAAKKPGVCCNEINIVRHCSDAEFKNEGFKCVEKGQCFDKVNGRENSGIMIDGESFIKADRTRCPSENQVCCRKDEPPPTKTASVDICEDHEGYECLNPRACDLDNPLFPTLKKKVEKQEQVEDTADLLFSGDLFGDLFSASNIDGENVIEQNSEVSLCEKASQLCCHRKTTPPPTTTSTTTTAAPVSDPGDVRQTKVAKVFAPRCGVHTQDGLAFAKVTGKQTQEGEWPHTCILFRLDGGENLATPEIFAGASLIAAGVLVTAAHKVQPYIDDPENVRVRCGEWDLRSDQEWYKKQDREVDSFTIHPKFFDNPNKLYNDIALVHVKKDFDLADVHADENLNVAPICLPAFDEVDFQEKNCVSMGWGKKSFSAKNYEETMKQVTLPIVKNAECQEALRTKTRLPSLFRLHPSFVCAGGNAGEDTCEGDGGGPLVCESKDDPNRYILTGIISWGIDCGKEGVPGVYGSVQKALCFIDYATKCKHGRKYTNFYNYREHCSNWIDEEIEAMRKKKQGKLILKAQALKESCIPKQDLPRQ